MKHVIEYDCKCQSCGGTGLYVGLAERDGAAVVCYRCSGTGKQHMRYEYEDFEGRVPKQGVDRVLQVNPGIVVGRCADGPTTADFGGMSYADWSAGKPFPPKSEMRRFTCPKWWYQSADYKRGPDWDECNESLGRSFSHCPHFANKAGCWARFDREPQKDAGRGNR